MDRGVEGSAGHGHEQVVGIRVQGGDQRAGTFDAGTLERRVLGHVPGHRRMADGGQALDVTVDHDDLLAGVVQVAGHLPADTSPSADHHVTCHLLDVVVHAAPPDPFPHVPVDEPVSYTHL